MGGLACIVRRFATITFESVPTDPAQLAVFDTQMRTFWSLATIPETLVDEQTKSVKAVCDALKKRTWSMTDRTTLLDAVESLYPDSYA